MAESKFFTSRKIYENVTLITGLAGEQCYLIEGQNKALLIDALTGAGSLRAFVRELTNLPVVLVNTHGHPDHIGADFEYGTVYISPYDVEPLYRNGNLELRLNFVQHRREIPDIGLCREDITVPCPIKTLPLEEGDIFDLGGVSLEVIAVPGHTRGTVVFLDRARRVLYSGDACNCNTLLCCAESTTVEQYREGLLHLKTFLPAFDCLWGGHGGNQVPAGIVEEAITLCDEILAGTDDAVEASSMGRSIFYGKAKNDHFQRLDGGIANIAYLKDRIRK